MRRGAPISRRDLLAGAGAAAAAACLYGGAGLAQPAPDEPQEEAAPEKALVAITLDLEMSRNFPKWEDGRWDYEKGNLDDQTKQYAVEAARRVKARGGVVHFFLVGRALEQENVDWLKGIAQAGHPVGNHTYDHVNVKATRPEDIQYRFNRAPWLIEGKEPAEVIRENVRLASEAIKTRVGVDPAGFRTPGGFPDGLSDREDVRLMLQELGFEWVSSRYPAHLNSEPAVEPTEEVYRSIVDAQRAAQPFVYPGGLVEIPMSPASDISAFRGGRWELDWFLKSVRLGVEWAIENKAVYDFLGHPSCLYVTDPQFKAIDLICESVERSGGRAELTDMGTISARIKEAAASFPSPGTPGEG